MQQKTNVATDFNMVFKSRERARQRQQMKTQKIWCLH